MNMFKRSPAVLFTPGTKPERFAKAFDSGANGIIIDLEDSVAAQDKNEARMNAFEFLSQAGGKEFIRILRINSLSTQYGLKDLLALSEQNKLFVDAILYPKSENAEALNIVTDVLQETPNNIPLIALIESGIGLENIDDTVEHAKNLQGIMFGAADFAKDMGCSIDYDALHYARSAIINAASITKIATYDTPYFDFANSDGLKEETKLVAALGFTGKAAIHPKQIQIIRETFKPSDAAFHDAEMMIDIYDKAKGAACQFEGKMIDVPVYLESKHVVELYNALS